GTLDAIVPRITSAVPSAIHFKTDKFLGSSPSTQADAVLKNEIARRQGRQIGEVQKLDFEIGRCIAIHIAHDDCRGARPTHPQLTLGMSERRPADPGKGLVAWPGLGIDRAEIDFVYA